MPNVASRSLVAILLALAAILTPAAGRAEALSVRDVLADPDAFARAVEEIRATTDPAPDPGGRPRSEASLPDVWLIGDSITAAYQGFVASARPEWDVHGLGLGGETSLQAVSRIGPLLEAAVGEEAPEVCVILYGTNDIAHAANELIALGLWIPELEPRPLLPLPIGNPLRMEAVVARIVSLAEMCEERGAVALLGLPIGLPNVPLAPFAKWFAEQFLVLRRGLVRAEQKTVDFRLRREAHFQDPFHATLAAAEKKHARKVARKVRSTLRRRRPSP